MKTLFTILFLVIVVAVGIGFYRGWFTVTNPASNQQNKTNINLEVDGNKMNDDAEAIKRKAGELKDNITGEKGN